MHNSHKKLTKWNKNTADNFTKEMLIIKNNFLDTYMIQWNYKPNIRLLTITT